MIEYATAMVLIFLTFIFAFVNIKIPFFGLILIVVDLVAFSPDLLSTGTVIIGYDVNEGVITALTQSFSWVQYVGVLAIAFCAVTFLLKMAGRID